MNTALSFPNLLVAASLDCDLADIHSKLVTPDLAFTHVDLSGAAYQSAFYE